MPVLDFERMKIKGMTFKGKVIDVYQTAKRKTKNTIDWVRDNPKEAAAVAASATAVFAGANKMIRGLNRHITARRERYVKERFIYDRSLNAYLQTTRKLGAKDVAHINEIRRKTGKRVSEILDDMHLLKK